jgi:4-hydroxy-3-methylbut-2-enyl diphosphate reductase
MGKMHLTVDVDPRSGFCFGVVKAITKAEEVLRSGGTLYCLGQIVHNGEEVRRLEGLGMVTVNLEELKNLHGQKVLIRAHGEPPETYTILRENGNEILDATCPIVLKLQDRVITSEGQGNSILIFGKASHPEVVGLVGHLKGNAIVFKDFEELDIEKLPRQVTLYSQTTMSIDKLYTMREKLVEAGISVILKDTVCRQVSGRREVLQEFCRVHSAVVFIAGTDSSNGKVLYDACLQANPRTYKIASAAEIDPAWFNPGDSVGVCGATSTPAWQMEEARDFLERQ